MSRNVIAGAAESFEACLYPVDGVHEGHGLAEGIVEGRAIFGGHAWWRGVLPPRTAAGEWGAGGESGKVAVEQ